jgi:hypothetical protein
MPTERRTRTLFEAMRERRAARFGRQLDRAERMLNAQLDNAGQRTRLVRRLRELVDEIERDTKDDDDDHGDSNGGDDDPRARRSRSSGSSSGSSPS